MSGDKSVKNKEFRDNFLKICSENQNIIYIKDFSYSLKDKMTPEVLEYGLVGATLAAIKDGQTKMLELILELAEKLNVKLEGRRSLNIAAQKGNTELMEFLDKRLFVLQKDLTYNKEIVENNPSKVITEQSKNDLEKQLDKYNKNVLKFCMQSKSEVAFKYLLNNFDIVTTLLEEVFIDSCKNELSQSTVTFLKNEKIFKKLVTSDLVTSYLNEPNNSDFNVEIKNIINRDFKQCFFSICEKGESHELNKMLLNFDIKKRLDSNMLCAGLFASIFAEKTKTIDIILDLTSQLNVELKSEDLTPIFNMLIEKGDNKQLDQLDSQFNFFKNQFNKEGYISIIDNKFRRGYAAGGQDFDYSADTLLKQYSGNVLTRSLENENHLTYLLNKDYPINPTFVEELFLDVCVDKNMNAARVLLSHEKTKNIIHNSSELNGYMQESTENKEFKDEVRALINSLDLKNKLEDKLVDKTTIKKVKL